VCVNLQVNVRDFCIMALEIWLMKIVVELCSKVFVMQVNCCVFRPPCCLDAGSFYNVRLGFAEIEHKVCSDWNEKLRIRL